jgi:hypothetical protein
MIVKSSSVELRTKILIKKLTSFFSNAPFDVNVAVSSNQISVQRIDRQDGSAIGTECSLKIDNYFNTVENDVATLRSMLISRGWYLQLVQEISIDVKPDPLEIDALANIEDVDRAVRDASVKKIFVFWTIERVNERANQLLLSRQDRPGEISVVVANIPLINLLKEIELTDLQDRWNVLRSRTRDAYVVGSDSTHMMEIK